MNKTTLLFTILVVYPMTLSASNEVPINSDEIPEAVVEDMTPLGEDPVVQDVLADSRGLASIDELPIDQAEIKSVTNIFWNAQNIQDTVKTNLPDGVKSKFTRGNGGQGCDVKAVTKSEGSADACEMSDDPLKMAKFIYNFDISCNFGTYKVSVCSREERKLLNQLKVDSPGKVVSDKKPLEPEA